jgi:hypothetical protein
MASDGEYSCIVGGRRDDRRIADLPAARATRYQRLLAATQAKVVKVDTEAVEFELWGYGLPPDVWRCRGVVWATENPARSWLGGGFKTKPLGAGWYLYEEWNS